MEHEASVEGVGVGVSDEGPGAPVVLLRAREELIPIFISADQAKSMQLAIEGEPFERPLTHDLLVDMVAEFGAAIDKVRIDDLADGTFYAKVDTEQYHDNDRKRAVFDARPSDGVALALRVDCPLIVTDEVIDEAGRPPEEFESEPAPDDEAVLGGTRGIGAFEPEDEGEEGADEADEADEWGEVDDVNVENEDLEDDDRETEGGETEDGEREG